MNQRTIYVALLDDGTDVWRPVDAKEIREGLFRIVSAPSNPDDECWEFEPGSLVRCEERQLSGGSVLVAVARATA